jgi:hypothetical protein
LLTLLALRSLALLTLLALRSLTGGLIPLLGLTLLALLLALLRLTGLRLLLTLTRLRLAGRLLALALRLAALRGLPLLALFRLALLRLLLVLARLCLTGCLLLLPLFALTTLHLLVACSRRAAFGLRTALGRPGLAGGFAAHILSRRDGNACQQRSCAE